MLKVNMLCPTLLPSTVEDTDFKSLVDILPHFLTIDNIFKQNIHKKEEMYFVLKKEVIF